MPEYTLPQIEEICERLDAHYRFKRGEKWGWVCVLSLRNSATLASGPGSMNQTFHDVATRATALRRAGG